jgi:hypothetical protein
MTTISRDGTKLYMKIEALRMSKKNDKTSILLTNADVCIMYNAMVETGQWTLVDSTH